MDKNRELHELFGRCWHHIIKDKSCYGHYVCSCGIEFFKYHDFANHKNKHNPDYAADPRLVLRGMEEKLPFFVAWIVTEKHIGGYYSITKLIAIDQTGKLRDLAIEFLKERGK